MIKIEYLEEEVPVYDITVKDNENFYANDILVHNCLEILLPVTPMKSLEDENAEVALCILSNVNAGKIKTLDRLKKLAPLIIRSLDNVIDIQEYSLPAAKNSTINARYLGVGVSDWAHYLTRKKTRYDTQEALDLAEEFMEHWQFELLTASNELAKERGEAPWFREKSKYADGWLPNDGNWRFISHEKWEALRASIIKYGLRHLTLSAIPPAGCQTKDGRIQTNNGIKSISEIFKENLEVDIEYFENNSEYNGKFINLKTPFVIPTRKGEAEIKRVYINGKVPTRKITTEDGKIQEFSLNHKLLCNRDGKEIWVEVGDININDDIINI